jgi:hypothetical protein
MVERFRMEVSELFCGLPKERLNNIKIGEISKICEIGETA